MQAFLLENKLRIRVSAAGLSSDRGCSWELRTRPGAGERDEFVGRTTSGQGKAGARGEGSAIEHTWVNQGARAGKARAGRSGHLRTPALPPCSCPVPTTETKSPKSVQAWNSPICLLEQQLSPRSKLPKLLNVQLQLPALASALVTLLQFLAKPGTSVSIDAVSPCQAPVPRRPHCPPSCILSA